MGAVGKEAKIVVIGGGTGLSVLLKGLKKYTSHLTAVVTVSDDGGSSGRLRAEMGVLPPGDIRNCLVALAETETLMEEVFQHRFVHEGSLKGHNLGNLLLVALTEIAGDFISAIQEVSRLLKVRGRVLPATLEHVALGAHMRDGTLIYGETSIRDYGGEIKRLFLVPEKCLPVPDTIEAILEADIIVFGPGSLYSSIIPNLLVEGIGLALARSSARKIYVSNIMTEHGETDSYTAADHLRVITRYLPEPIIEYMIINNSVIGEGTLERYRGEQAIPVFSNRAEIAAMGIKLVEADLVSDSDLAWHDSDKLARVILEI